MVGLVQIKQSSDFFFVILQYLDTDVSKNIDTNMYQPHLHRCVIKPVQSYLEIFNSDFKIVL